MEVWGRTRFPPAEVALKVKLESRPSSDASEIPLGELSDGGISGTEIQPRRSYVSRNRWTLVLAVTALLVDKEGHSTHRGAIQNRI